MQVPAAPPALRGRFQGNELWQKHKALIISYGLILVILFIGWLRHPTFISAGNLRQQLVLSSFLGIIAAGQTILILTGGIDLSVAWNLNFAAIMLTKLAGNQNTFGSVTIAIIAALCAATLFGAINGLGVAFLRIPPLVMTLGMNTVLLGLTTYYTRGTPQGTAPKVIITLATKRIAGIPWALILWAVVTVAVVFMLRRTTLGANIYAIGNNSKAAYLSGVPVQRTLVICYAIAGFFAGVGALLLVGYSNQSYFRMGDPYVLTSIAAVVVGGTSILGGSGGYIGTIAGAIIITLLTNLLSVENRPRADQQILFGVIVLVMLLIYGRERKARQ
ncbi:MAG: ABC transporter permease [Thermomicrobiales bacterium]|nr:ABC transporter permease [Thermomicrobiales bacterium]